MTFLTFRKKILEGGDKVCNQLRVFKKMYLNELQTLGFLYWPISMNETNLKCAANIFSITYFDTQILT